METAALQHGTTEASPLLQEACARLRCAGLRITIPRVALINAMVRYGKPVAIEALHEAIDRSCDLVTVYRSVGTMHEIGLVHRVFSPSGVQLFELGLDPERLHVFDRATGDVQSIAEAPSPEMRMALQAIEDGLRERGYTAVEHVIQFFGQRRS